MSATPLYFATPHAFTLNDGFVSVTAALTDSSGAGVITGGTQSMFVALASTTNGTQILRCFWVPTATVAASAMAASTGRVFISSVSTGSPTASNTQLVAESSLPAINADVSTSAALVVDVPINGWILKNGLFILASNHVAPNTNTAWKLVLYAMDA